MATPCSGISKIWAMIFGFLWQNLRYFFKSQKTEDGKTYIEVNNLEE